MPPTADLISLLYHCWRTRVRLRFADRPQLLAWQQGQLTRFLAQTLPRAPFYRPFAGQPLQRLPIMNKATMMEEFDRLNTVGIQREEALAVALRAEQTRDFSPVLRGITVGLSSGTSGNRGLFLVSAAERRQWAGCMFAKVLPPSMPRDLLMGRLPQLRIAFFMRANSNLYATLGSQRVDFQFYDLLQGFAAHLKRLQIQQPHFLVAPSRVLRLLAEAQLSGELAVHPLKVFAVAEVLEPDDAQIIGQAFGEPVHQIYQCTEGFLGVTCERGTLHLNEELVHIEPEWLDAQQQRFVPIVTDFCRTTQLIVRYRLDDVLQLAEQACACGNPALAVAAIEGRADDVLWFRARMTDARNPIFADFMRRIFLLASDRIADYQVVQRDEQLQIAVRLSAGKIEEALVRQRVLAELDALCQQTDTITPAVEFVAYQPVPLHAKRRRIMRVSKASTAG